MSWLGVEQMAIFWSAPTINQAHPDPKRVAPAAANLVLNSSKLPKASLIAAANFPLGAPPLFGLMIDQNKEWLKCPPPLFLTAIGYFEIDLQISSMLNFSASVPAMALFKLVTYAA